MASWCLCFDVSVRPLRACVTLSQALCFPIHFRSAATTTPSVFFFASSREQRHKTDGMIDVVSRKCEVEGCLKRPWYSYDGVKSVLCAEHKHPGMIGYRPPQKDVSAVGMMASVVGGGGGVGGVRKRAFAMTIDHHHHDPQQHHPQHHHQQQHHQHHHHHHNPHNAVDGAPPDLDAADLESVGLVGMDMSEEALQGGEGLGLDSMGEEDHLGQSRMEVPGLGGGSGLDAAGIGDGGLDPTGMDSADHLGHGALGQRGLETPNLESGGEHDHHGGHHPHHHDDAMVLQPVLTAHVAHPSSIVGPSDKLFH